MPKHWAIPGEIDHEKFKARYGLAETDFKVGPIGSKWYLIVFDTALAKVTNDPPITESPRVIEAPATVSNKSGPVRLAAGTAQQDRAAVTLTPGSLLTFPQLGALEFIDDGVNGSIYITLHVKGVLTRMRLI